MDRYMKVVFTVIAIALVSLAVKDVDLFPIAEAQQGWEIENDLAMMDGSMQALPASGGYAYICRSYLVPGGASTGGEHGYLTVTFRTEPQCMGAWVGSGRIFSDGATVSDSDWRYKATANNLHFFADAAARAADTGQRVRYVRCSDEKDFCLKYIEFRGDPNEVDDAD